MRLFAREQKLTYYFELGEMGIEHALLPEKGLVLPGDLVIGADSHTCTYGALGAFASGMGSTDLGAAMITGRTWFKVPETIKLVYQGNLEPWVSGKDLILYTIGDLGVDGARYQAMEFTGPALAGLSMADRFTMANMAIEAGAKIGIFEPDEKTRAYVRERSKKKGQSTIPIPGRNTRESGTIIWGKSNPRWPFPICRRMPGPYPRWEGFPSIRRSSGPAPTADWKICVLPPRCLKGKKLPRASG